jgi:hypothetical protein
MNSCNVLLVKNIAVKIEKSADYFSKNDPYVRVVYGNMHQQITTKVNIDSATWKQQILFPYLEGDVDTFTVHVFDEDEYTKDDMVITNSILSETFTISHDSAEKGLSVEQNGIKLFYGIGRFCLLNDMKNVYARVDEISHSVHRVYSSFKNL